MGKAMLAADFREVRAIVGPGPYPRRTEHSITTYEELVTELAEIQRLGYAVDRQELNLGVWCVAAPIAIMKEVRGLLRPTWPSSTARPTTSKCR